MTFIAMYISLLLHVYVLTNVILLNYFINTNTNYLLIILYIIVYLLYVVGYVLGSFTYGAKLWPACLAVTLGLVRDEALIRGK